MSKKKLIKIDKKALEKALKDAGRTQVWLCEELHVDYGNFNKKVNRGVLAYADILAIAQVLDINPNVITGKENFGAEPIKNDFSMYERSLIDAQSLTKDLLIYSGFTEKDFKDLNKRDFWTINFLLQDVCKVFMSETEHYAIGKRKELPDGLKEFKKDLSPRIEWIKTLVNSMKNI